MNGLFTKLRFFLASAHYKRSIALIIVLIIAAIIPLTVITSQKTQEIRQRASVPDSRIGNACSSGADCAPNTTCNNGLCRLNSGQTTDSGIFTCCGIDSQCSDNQACTGNEGFCDSGRKCGSPNLKSYGQNCDRSSPRNNVCDTNLTCASNGVCKYNSGVGDGAGNQCCGIDSQCSGTQYCGSSGTSDRCESGRRCMDRVGVGRACSNQSACQDNLTCTNGQCRWNSGQSDCCGADNQCSGTQYCASSNAQHCSSYKNCQNRVGVNQSCSSQSACQDNLTCINGTCKWNNGTNNCCASDSNCGNGQVCTGSGSSCSSGKTCAAAPAPTSTPIPPTNTPVPPTNTPIPPTTTGCIVPKAQGNANNDCDVDSADYTIWRAEFIAGSGTQADFNGNGTTDLIDFNIWRNRAFNLQ